jgi:DNA invertase Pin-like site-specific DNA recombinase
MKTAGCYVRVSPGNPATASQLDTMTRYCAARGWTARTFIDDQLSGAFRDRPQFEALLAAARQRTIDLVVATRLDRLARSTVQLLTMAEELRELGVDLVVTEQAIDTTTPAGRLMFHVLAAVAEFERDLIQERRELGVASARRRGVRFGRPRVHHVNAVRAAELRARGYSLRAIGKALRPPGTRRSIPPQTIRRALLSQSPPAAAGVSG